MLSIYPCLHITFTHVSIYASSYSCIHASIHLSIYIHPSSHLHTHPTNFQAFICPIYLYTQSPFTNLFIYPSIHPLIHLAYPQLHAQYMIFKYSLQICGSHLYFGNILSKATICNYPVSYPFSYPFSSYGSYFGIIFRHSYVTPAQKVSS